ncbi:hypothetical protein AVEN_218596-1 [Araneus ventricosus]|uniref:Uncharacterized protein n=1 Tax=Araneus ventricosus TaxID=182803 RepID=A0A4Y1ZS43_ARAVE|nr:hypothetical protein AVEN_231663-1 [Araneus ventricosus]GBL65318.1 hypothetical protein AVEN_147238-1 [Araneus ventricosus]GBL65346.1 hypothetical protein AVEN_206566-1 [Araneus ventricosus]GBL65352.1 hypothetical protein AVEN_218596-1 [Araneus ventricosus]
MQFDILKSKAMVDDVLKNIQNAFSLPSLFIIIANLLSCGIVIAWFLSYDFENFEYYMIIRSVFTGVNSFGCLIYVIWIAGGLPIQLQNLKEAFFEKAHSRLLLTRNLEESKLKTELLEQPDFLFTGCDILSYKRSTVLALLGTLLTYTVLIVSTKQASH